MTQGMNKKVAVIIALGLICVLVVLILLNVRGQSVRGRAEDTLADRSAPSERGSIQQSSQPSGPSEASRPYTDDHVVTVRVGRTRVLIPSPSGFVEVGDSIRQFIPVTPENELLSVFVTRADLPLIGTDSQNVLRRYMQLQVAKMAADSRITAAEFREEASLLRQQQDELFQQSRDDVNAMLKSLSEDSEDFPRLEVGEVVPLGVFLDQEDVAGFAFLTTIVAVGTSERETVVCGACLVRVKEKVLYAYVYAGYENEKSTEWVQQTARTWAQQIQDANR